MKKGLLINLLLVLLFGLSAKSQTTSNLIIFSENGEKFTVSVDGEIKNSAPQSNVKIQGLTGDIHRVKVNFEDKSLGSVNQNIMLESGLEQKAMIVFTKKGTYAIRTFGEPTAITASAPSPPTQPTPVDPQPATPLPPSSVSPPPAPETPAPRSSEVFSIDVNVNGNAVGMQVKMDDDAGVHAAIAEESPEYETTQTNTTRKERQSETMPSEKPSRVEVVDECTAMAGGDFAEAVKSINSKSFEDSKITTANQVLKSSCLSVDQIKKVMELMTYEESKINFAKAAYHRCPDRQNYWKLNDAFTFESSIDELNEYIETR